ncbi:MAG: branched-chain amino acid ABC transporter permease [Rivularia sp. ALOHA_DT_140]|nr:branched-chain amino acid ABC transporter permease [Rivularia sp. ALOHA_DT_140]
MQLLLNIVMSFFTLALIGYGYKIIYTKSGFFNLSHAITVTLGAYFTYFFSIQFGFNLFTAILLAILLSTIISLVISQFIYKTLKKRKTPDWQMLIVSLGIYIIIQNLVSMYFGDGIKSFRNWTVENGEFVLGLYITKEQMIIISVSTALLLLSWMFIETTSIGKKIKAVSSNPSLSNILGISTNRAILYSVTLGSVLASAAGILIAADADMTPTMGFNWLLYAVVAMIIGGMGKMRYLLTGALLLAAAQHLSAYYISSKWMNATAYIILIIFLYVKPYGFSGTQLKKVEI